MSTFDKKRIEEVVTKGKREQWPYPKIFDALKEAGVEYYEADVASHNIVYHGVGGTFTEAPPLGFRPLVPNLLFDRGGVQRAIQRNRAKQTGYRQFLGEIARAGIVKYRVDMKARTVTYFGAKG
jgi:uncharacterized protein YbcV (DUF1398 family)